MKQTVYYIFRLPRKKKKALKKALLRVEKNYSMSADARNKFDQEKEILKKHFYDLYRSIYKNFTES